MVNLRELIPEFEHLVGEKCSPVESNLLDTKVFDGNGIGFSQFNEIMLLLGFDRITESFFQYLVDGDLEYIPGSEIESIESLHTSVDRFRELALLFFGNINFAFIRLSKDEEELFDRVLARLEISEQEFLLRHEPINCIKKIQPEKAYLFGYYIEKQLKSKNEAEPDNMETLSLLKDRETNLELARQNQISYLTSDHLDIYVATSMREEHEFVFVNDLVNKIFKSEILKRLNLRWFDPTQAYCLEREDKGLSEALMLKRAICTLYLVQENDSLGKDSELASTLAQGKPVIAFVPVGDKSYVNELVENLKKSHSEKSEVQILLEQLKIFDPSLAWTNKTVQKWLNSKITPDIESIMQLLYKVVKDKYDARAKGLKEDHPLGIQVNLKSGVANGVLVVRTVKDCARLIKSIVTNKMEFSIASSKKSSGEYLYLHEKISDSIFRIQTGDALLTNSFWNFYLMS